MTIVIIDGQSPEVGGIQLGASGGEEAWEERSSNVCMALVLASQLVVPIPSPFAVCVQIGLGLRFGYLLFLTWLRDADSFFLLRHRSDLLARGWGSASHSADDLHFWMDCLR